MSKADDLMQHLEAGKVYRRADLEQWSNAVDRHVSQLVKQGFLEKLSPGLYHVPKRTVFGSVPPSDEALVHSFLKGDDFLLTSPNAYNGLGVGTTQLYNRRVVYNHKRHGEFMLGGKSFYFHAKHRFPTTLTKEFLLVDLLNNLDKIAEDREVVLTQALTQAGHMDSGKLRQAATRYGSIKTKKLLRPLLHVPQACAYAH